MHFFLGEASLVKENTKGDDYKGTLYGIPGKSQPSLMYSCKEKQDGTECMCKAKIMSCLPSNGAHCEGGMCKQGDMFSQGDTRG